MEFNPEQFRRIVRGWAERADARSAIAAVYAHVQEEIEARRPVCSVSGRCCRFEEFGHRLYVTTLELAAFVHDLELRSKAASPAPALVVAGTERRPLMSLPVAPIITQTAGALVADFAPAGGGCPFQITQLCGVHAFRPFGCRMFFCDATAAEWQNQTYERFHAELKRLHTSFQAPYFYMEWRAALRALDLMK